MATSARLPIAADRYTPCVRTIRLVGMDLTGVTMQAQVRLRPDTPGAPLINLATVTSATAQGLRLVSVTTDAGVPISTVTLRINETTMEGLPYGGELGDVTTLVWDWQATIAGDKRLLAGGAFTIVPGVTGADAAPSNRSAGFGGSSGAATWSTAQLTFSNDDVTVVIDGAGLAAGYAEQATNAASAAELASASALASSRYFATRSAGESGSTTNQFFSTDDGSGNLIYYRRTAGGSVEIGRALTPASLSAVGGATMVGFQAAGGVARTVAAKVADLPTPGDVGVALEPSSLAIGREALGSPTSGVRNTGFGYRALKANTGGNENTAAGYLALSSVTGGSDPAANYNTAFGSYALASLTVGFKNAAVGRASADNLTSGYQNTALGYGSFHWATTALNCVAVGFEAVHGGESVSPAIGQGLVGVGFQALYAATGDFNTAVGTSAGRNITTGARNTAVGTNALNQLLTGSDNTAIGYAAGLNNTGSGSIFIGQASDAAPGLANVTVIGTGLTATASNTLLLGKGQTVLPGTTAADIGSQAKPWGFVIASKSVSAHSGTAPPAGGTTGAGYLLGPPSNNFGIFFGSGAPTLSAARGSLYLRTDGSGTSNRLYVNTDNGTTWTAVTTAL